MRRLTPLLALLLALPAAIANPLPGGPISPASTLDPKLANLGLALHYQQIYLAGSAARSFATLPGLIGQAGTLAGSALQPPAPSLPGLLGYANGLVRDSGDLLHNVLVGGPLAVQPPVQNLIVIPATILLYGP